ncbi:hypothetical protein KC19_4G234800 [Ceratodon purpureus]|uniref:Uncharacterized protein n=1 Tax=Ceratodon purpureus TaxID=3225 RepID=A0A8T0IBW8_CERPU|nr:hypothetical protein KC19_4G234800 [Ceratodon purpureus]
MAEPQPDQFVCEIMGRSLENVRDWEGVANIDTVDESLLNAKNSVWIKQNSLYSEAHQNWEGLNKATGERLERREKRSEELTNQIYNLVGFFSVFQGVIFTAVTQLTQSTQPAPVGCPSRPPLCRKVWVPVVLSGLAAIVAAVGIWLKFSALHSIDKHIHIEFLDQREARRKLSKLQGEGHEFKFSKLKKPEKPKDTERSHWILKAILVILTVVAFTLIFIMSYFVILCDKFVL